MRTVVCFLGWKLKYDMRTTEVAVRQVSVKRGETFREGCGALALDIISGDRALSGTVDQRITVEFQLLIPCKPTSAHSYVTSATTLTSHFLRQDTEAPSDASLGEYRA